MNWQVTNRADARAALMADRHYSRQTVGARQFTPPGRVLVLVTPDYGALWATSWPYPQYVHREWQEAWICCLFRNEAPARYVSSELITQAIAATRWCWPEIPPLGMITLINAWKVNLPKVRAVQQLISLCLCIGFIGGALVAYWGHMQDISHGWCYYRAGFRRIGYTQGGLIALQLRPDQMPDPAPPLNAQYRLLGVS